MAGAKVSDVDDVFYDLLAGLAEVMFPMAAWIEKKNAAGGFKPRRHVPWREPGQDADRQGNGR